MTITTLTLLNMPAPTLTIQSIGQIAINVEDVSAATAFYRDVLGLKFLFNAGEHLSFLACGGVRLMVSKLSSPEFQHPSSILYFVVPDIDAAFDSLVAHGVTIAQPPHLTAKMPDHDLWMCFFRDPAQNLLALMCEKSASR